MLLGARTGAWSGGFSAKSYVQDGLVAMWDGIENAGWGTHDASATVWKDLIGSCNLTRGSQTEVGADYIKSTTKTGTANKDSSCVSDSILDFSYYEAVGSGVISDRDAVFFSQQVVSGSNNNIMYLIIAPSYVRVGKINGNGYGVYNLDIDTSKKISISTEYSTSGNVYINGTPYAKEQGGAWNWSSSIMVCNFKGNYQTCPSSVNCLRLYNRALTAAEVAKNYAIDKARFGLT